MRGKRAFYEGLASMLDAGIPVRSALDHLASQASAGPFGEAVKFLRWQAEQGRPLADAMAARPEFTPLEVEIVRAAETVGTLDRAARTLAGQEERRDRLRGQLLAKVTYPVVVLHLVPMPFAVMALMKDGVFRFVLTWVGWLLPLYALVGAVLLVRARLRPSGAWGRFVCALPAVGGIVRDLSVARWARTFAAMEDAGIAADVCTVRAAGATGLPHMERALAAPAEPIRRGVSRAEAFAAAPLPPEVYHALATGEVAGSIAKSLDAAASVLEHKASTRAEALIAVLPIVLTILVGVVVLVVALNVVGGYYGQALR